MISLRQVTLRYPLVGMYSHSLQRAVYGAVGGLIGRERGVSPYVEALKSIDLEIPDGQRLGIIGHNGAGKTTLLRVIAGVYPVTSGSVSLSGRVNALTDVTLGMDLNASGIKNILFRLIFMGHSYAEARGAIDEIVAFSDLGDFIHLPIHTYSTGMNLRLAFAIATHFPPDILLLDEIIGAGDESFRAKAQQRMDRLLSQSRIVVLSSHDLKSMEKYCNAAIVMHHGQIAARGDVKGVVQKYKDIVASSRTPATYDTR
ncbi:MAG: ABC transporter ATP-binding protein [Xanthobacteraceae bacterium]|nr:ABC transporter ATP-binding protein [Xanthobacteraceae bacterium]